MKFGSTWKYVEGDCKVCEINWSKAEGSGSNHSKRTLMIVCV